MFSKKKYIENRIVTNTKYEIIINICHVTFLAKS